jgi:hypothetical protein
LDVHFPLVAGVHLRMSSLWEGTTRVDEITWPASGVKVVDRRWWFQSLVPCTHRSETIAGRGEFVTGKIRWSCILVQILVQGED